jgi:serine/threonine-protein kinase
MMGASEADGAQSLDAVSGERPRVRSGSWSSTGTSDGSFGKYQLIAELGHGGMSDVFLAAARGPAGFGFSKLFVVKRLRPDLVEDQEFVNMLIDEARLSARLNHPNVVQTLEVGRVDKHYFIAMEYLEGQPLHRILSRAQRRDGGMPKELQYLVLSEVLAGLHHAHELRDYDGKTLEVVHRDVTPHNIFVTYEGQVKVVDFGIAKAVGRMTSTRTGVLKGKLKYMAPEQALGDEVDRRVDIFALGIMLWEAATGLRMWETRIPEMALLTRLLAGDFPSSPQEMDPNVPDGIDAICRRALAYRPEDRHATAAEFQAELDRARQEGPHDAPLSQRRPVANRDLGRYVSGLFEDQRHHVQELIEQQMAVLGELCDMEDLVTLPAPKSLANASMSGISSPGTLPAASEPPPGADGESSLGPTEAPIASSVARGRQTTRRWPAVAAVVTLAALTGYLVVAGPLRRQPTSAGVGAVSVAAAAAPVSSSVKREHAPPSMVRVTLEATPAHAVFLLDGKALSGSRFEGVLPAGPTPRTLRVEAAGYEPVERVLVIEKDVVLGVTLQRSRVAVRNARALPPRARPGRAAVAPAGPQPQRSIDEEDPW